MLKKTNVINIFKDYYRIIYFIFYQIKICIYCYILFKESILRRILSKLVHILKFDKPKYKFFISILTKANNNINHNSSIGGPPTLIFAIAKKIIDMVHL